MINTQAFAILATLVVACSSDGDASGGTPTNSAGGAAAASGAGGLPSQGGTGGLRSSSGGSGGVKIGSGGLGQGGGSGGIAMNSTGGRGVDSGAPWYCDESSAFCLCDHTQIGNPIGCKMKWGCCYQNKSGVPYCDCQPLDAATCLGFEGPGNTGARIVPNCN